MDFNHHPNPAIDFCVEVDVIEGLIFDANHGMADPAAVQKRIENALRFVTGADEQAVMAKNNLRKLAAMFTASAPSGGRSDGEA